MNLDLDAKDRATLLVWRTANLVGWAVAGTVCALLIGALTTRVLSGLGSIGGPSWLAPFGIVIGVAGAIAVPVSAGIVVGDHVYRWPGWAAGVSIGLTLVVWQILVARDLEDLILGSGFALIDAVIAGGVARTRFFRRPRALRAPG
jgi:hypothetical protein